MVISFPRPLPEIGYSTADFTLDDGVAASDTRGRLTNYTNVSDPFWSASLVTVSLAYADFSALQSWWFSLRGGTRSKGVLFYNPRVRYPQAHWQNRAPAEDDGLLTSVADGNVLQVSGVSPALILSDVDFIGIEYLSRYYIGKVVEVSGVGANRTITVEPPPYSAVAQSGAKVRFANIPLLMRPVPNSFSPQASLGRYTVSFKLQEA